MIVPLTSTTMSTSNNESGIEPDLDQSLDSTNLLLDYNYADEHRIEHATKRNFRAIYKSKQPPKVQPSRESFGPRDIDPTPARPVSIREDLSLSTLYNSSCYKSYYEQMYETIRKIGEGSFGEVFKVRCKDDGKLYAVKKTKVRFAHKWDRRNKIEEVKRHEKIPQHDNCVQLIFSWEEHDYLYIQLELCETSLEDFTRDFLIPEPSVWNVLLDLLLAVKHLHDLNIIHLDIKLENILIALNGRCKLADFGIAMDLAKGNPTDGLDGDAKYLAPEVLANNFSKAADVFSLGIVTLEISTDLVIPRRGPLWHELRQDILPTEYLRKLSAALVVVIQAMMTSNPIHRPSVNQVLTEPCLSEMRSTLRPTDLNQSIADLLRQHRTPDTSLERTTQRHRIDCTPPCPHISSISPRKSTLSPSSFRVHIPTFPSLLDLDDSYCKMEEDISCDTANNETDQSYEGYDDPACNLSPIAGCGTAVPHMRIVNSTPQHPGKLLKTTPADLADGSWTGNARRLFK